MHPIHYSAQAQVFRQMELKISGLSLALVELFKRSRLIYPMVDWSSFRLLATRAAGRHVLFIKKTKNALAVGLIERFTESRSVAFKLHFFIKK